jgi:hypothetical protein
MKLSTQQVAAVRQELGADPVDEANPAMETLRNAFGDHTFYLASDGLFVLEPADKADTGSAQEPAEQMSEPAHLVLVAAWTDENKNALQPAPAQVSATVVDLAATDDNEGKQANGKA